MSFPDPPPASRAPERITLLTDFGTVDGYVGAMRGVIASIAPRAVVDDIGHDLPAGDIAAAAWSLVRYWNLYPEGTIHVVIVDPGVGTPRRAIAIEAYGRRIVAPDNGCATLVLAEVPAARTVAIENPAYLRHPVSRTFHGRDVFAPAAAHLANGAALDTFGSVIDDPVRLPLPAPRRNAGEINAAVVHVDRFGNLITNLSGEWAADIVEIEIEGRTIGPVRDTYGSVAPGEVVALVGSAGLIEVSIRNGDAASVLSAAR
ncbi:MAG: SAM hydrolase/SAM-dependent halogenase family protein, partial [Longimicrobiales bacterium]